MKKNWKVFALTTGILIGSGLILASTAMNRAQAAGSISGRVTDSGGDGIGNIRVDVYVSGLADSSDGYRTNVLTDDQGYYTISSLLDGSYAMHFTDYQLARYFDEWYDDQSVYATAVPVAVTGGGPTSGVNVQMTKAGRISGRLTDQDGKGLSGVVVGVYDLNSKFIQGWASDSDGNYVVTYLPPGSYKVNFSGSFANNLSLVPEWYSDKADFASADPVSVMFETTTSDIDAQLQFQENGTISGRIVDSSGKGIQNIEVRAYDGNTQNLSGYAVSDADGGYAIPSILPGSYKVQFEDGLLDQFAYYSEWFNDKASFQEADAVHVASGKTADNIDAVLIKKKVIDVSRRRIDLAAVQSGPMTPPATVVISNSGVGTLNWTATSSVDFISVLPAAGAGNGLLTIGIAHTDLAPGHHGGMITITDPEACNSPCGIQVDVNIIAAGADQPPFGGFDTPLEGTTVSSSIPVTGWALDDVGVQSVKIYQGRNENDRTYIGDAVFVEGARPDIDNRFIQEDPMNEKLWWYYPEDEKAGWGYMLLTNFLPDGGNGTFTLLAYATDLSGHEILLGSKTITCDNANAIRPFGAIDTPAQGGAASGPDFIHFGWALTPQPNVIPFDGSTLNVWVDGLPLGHPVYNNFRADIASLFPGYANSDGAVGYYHLDTTGYADGLHTIAWSAVDSAGNMDGIGSRYFMIQNTGPKASASAAADPSQTAARRASAIAAMPEDVRSPVYVKRGMAAGTPAETMAPEADGSIRIVMPQVARLAVYLNERAAFETEEEMIERGRRIRDGIVASREARVSEAAPGEPLSRLRGQDDFRSGKDLRLDRRSSARYEAYRLVGEELRPLPVGSSFDPETGAFYWQPGPGFIGEYGFVIVDSLEKTRKTIFVTIQ